MAKQTVVSWRERQGVPEALTGEQSAVLAQLVAGASQKDAAAAAGVAQETVSRWMNGDPLFVATLNAMRREVWRSAADRLAGLAADALTTLETLMTSGSDSVRLRAAVAVLGAVGLLAGEKPNGETDAAVLSRDWQAKETMLSLSLFG